MWIGCRRKTDPCRDGTGLHAVQAENSTVEREKRERTKTEHTYAIKSNFLEFIQNHNLLVFFLALLKRGSVCTWLKRLSATLSFFIVWVSPTISRGRTQCNSSQRVASWQEDTNFRNSEIHISEVLFYKIKHGIGSEENSRNFKKIRRIFGIDSLCLSEKNLGPSRRKPLRLEGEVVALLQRHVRKVFG